MFDKIADFLSNWYVLVPMILILVGLIVVMVIMRNKRSDDE